MENFALVDVLYGSADLDEKLEDSIFGKEFASLPVDLGVEVAEGVETEGRCHHQYELLAALLLPMLLLLLETLAEETIISIMSSCPPPCMRVQTPVLARQDTILG